MESGTIWTIEKPVVPKAALHFIYNRNYSGCRLNLLTISEYLISCVRLLQVTPTSSKGFWNVSYPNYAAHRGRYEKPS